MCLIQHGPPKSKGNQQKKLSQNFLDNHYKNCYK
jgi:hypothetical protein